MTTQKKETWLSSSSRKKICMIYLKLYKSSPKKCNTQIFLWKYSQKGFWNHTNICTKTQKQKQIPFYLSFDLASFTLKVTRQWMCVSQSPHMEWGQNTIISPRLIKIYAFYIFLLGASSITHLVSKLLQLKVHRH